MCIKPSTVYTERRSFSNRFHVQVKANKILILQIAKVFKVTMDSEYLRVKQLNVEQQEGVVDCGLFAIAFAVQMCYKRNPTLAVFDQKNICLILSLRER